jgi:hypothetical protein
MVYNNVTEKTWECIRRRCGNNACVFPEHLFEGVIRKTGDDTIDNVNFLRGENNPSSKISKDTAYKIKFGEGTPKERLEKFEHFGATRDIVQSIDRGHCWGHLKIK